MPIIDHNNAPEVPWRPNYRKWAITQEGDGTTSTDASISEVGVGTGAPLHTHEDDELIVVLSGTLSVRYGDETHEVGADHTIVVPPNVPHGFTAIGDGLAQDEAVSIAGFGTFSVKKRPARPGRNPRTGVRITIAASSVPSFKASNALRDATSQAFRGLVADHRGLFV